jgi:hypothetical protein
VAEAVNATDEELVRMLSCLSEQLNHATATPSVVWGDGVFVFSWHKNGWDVEIEMGERVEIWAKNRQTDQALFGDDLSTHAKFRSEVLDYLRRT